MNRATYKGETGDILRTLLINMCTDSGFLSKRCSHSDCVPSDESLHVAQSVPVTGVMEVVYDRNESKCEMLSPVTDCSTLDELQQFIDLSYQNVVAHECPLHRLLTLQPLSSRDLPMVRPP